MSQSTALRRYLERHIETDLPDCPAADTRWQHVLVIPAYRESALLLPRLQTLQPQEGRLLVLLVLNRPDIDPDSVVNEELRAALQSLSRTEAQAAPLNTSADLYVYDTEQAFGPLPASEGVGRARKYGCDLALKWIAQGAIDSPWIHSTDADAELPPDYFSRLQNSRAVAATFPFHHRASGEQKTDDATALYELRLHYYMLGLEYAGSPYAYHTLGSCLAFTAEAYAQVRGFPKRAGGEDFYLLNKLAKVGEIERLKGRTIQLESRTSHRVPFGTGPAVQRIAECPEPKRLAIFYDPDCFRALRALLDSIDQLPEKPLAGALQETGLDDRLAAASEAQLKAMGLDNALDHCRRQSRSESQFRRQFHQWFDGFRSLKLVHGLRERGWPDLSLEELSARDAVFWPAYPEGTEPHGILRIIYKELDWDSSVG